MSHLRYYRGISRRTPLHESPPHPVLYCDPHPDTCIFRQRGVLAFLSGVKEIQRENQRMTSRTHVSRIPDSAKSPRVSPSWKSTSDERRWHFAAEARAYKKLVRGPRCSTRNSNSLIGQSLIPIVYSDSYTNIPHIYRIQRFAHYYPSYIP